MLKYSFVIDEDFRPWLLEVIADKMYNNYFEIGEING